MRLAKTILAAFMLTAINSVTWAQQTLTGTVTTIDRINGTIAIQQPQSGTVGASAGGATERFKVQDGMLNTVHAGDKVVLSVSEAGGTKTITKLEKQ
jgi:Cu/Ag efflux protein CusF